MVLPNNFKDTGEQSIASYNYIDSVGGQGYKRFYACGSETNAGMVYFLTNQVISASENAITADATSDLTADTDFDLTFQTPAIIQGVAYANITTVQGGSASLYSTINVYHVRGVTETLLGTNRTAALGAYGGGNHYARQCLAIDLTKKAFAIGDKLRVNVVLTGGGSGTVLFYIDPSSRLAITENATGATIPSNTYIDIPFKIDL